MKNTAFTLIALFATPTFCHAQKLVESRDQASGWYVPVKLQVTAEGTKAKNLAVQVYQDNELLQEIHSKKGKFTLNLDLDNTYTFVLNQEGYRPKSVFIDTHVPVKQVQYSEYACYMNLEAADKFTHSDPFYMDFPGAIVRWNDESHGFMPSICLLYTSDAADERSSVDLGGRRIIQKTTQYRYSTRSRNTSRKMQN